VWCEPKYELIKSNKQLVESIFRNPAALSDVKEEGKIIYSHDG